MDFFFYENKMILAHHALDVFPCNAKQEIIWGFFFPSFNFKYQGNIVR